MNFGILNFVFSGSAQAFASLWFYLLKDQDSYFIYLIVMMVLATLWVAVFVPESPKYLLKRQ